MTIVNIVTIFINHFKINKITESSFISAISIIIILILHYYSFSLKSSSSIISSSIEFRTLLFLNLYLFKLEDMLFYYQFLLLNQYLLQEYNYNNFFQKE